MKLNLLKAKNWQIFLLTIGVLFLFPIIISISTSFNGNVPFEKHRQFNKFIALVLFPGFTFIITFVYFRWLYSIGVKLQKILPNELTKSTKLFRVAIVFPILFIPFTALSLVLFIFAHSPEYMDAINLYGKYYTFIYVLLFPLAVLSIPYIFYFAARTLKTAELQRKTNLSDYFLDIILILLFPFGIWILQPRVNQLAKKLEHKQSF